MGGETPIAPTALAEVGLHVQAFVDDGAAVGARKGPDASIVRRLPSSAEPDPKPEACSP